MKQGFITMSQRESTKIHVIQKLSENLIRQKQAAEILKISIRHTRRLLTNFKKIGIFALIHKSRGTESPKKTNKKISQKIINLYKNTYKGFTITHFTEKLNEVEKIKISKETVRQILISDEAWIDKPKKHKHRKQRERMPNAGMLVQMDGSVDPWFENRGPRCVLMSFIDDATSSVYAKFYTYEGTLPAMDCLVGYIQKYGIPLALYADLHQTYHVNNKKVTIEDQLNNTLPASQFEKAISQLGIQMINAHSPQAKGRVERFFQTFQDRLKSELRLNKISTIEEANKFLPEFLKDFNKRFSHPELSTEDVHKDALPTSVLRKILVTQNKHSVGKDFTFRHNCHVFQIMEPTIQKNIFFVETTDGKQIVKEPNGKELKFKMVTKTLSKLKRKNNYLPAKINQFSLKEIYD
ncbi:MAG: ISNCY family transposase [Bacteroidales bacterium]|nr:ISNCY family transposase [Bacteroidales bacterium]